MEYLLGIQCSNFVILATDANAGRSILTMKTDQDKMIKLSDRLLMSICGEPGDTNQFAEFIQQNMQLYKIRQSYELTPNAAVNFTRRNLADALRSKNAYNVNVLLAGYDSDKGPELYFMDYLAAAMKVPFACHGYGGFMTYGLLDRYYKPDMTLEQAVELIKMCLSEIEKRFIVKMPRLKVRYVDKDGLHELPDVNIYN